MAIDVKLLKSTAYFSGMDSAELEFIKSLIQETPVPKGNHFLSEGESSDCYRAAGLSCLIGKSFTEWRELIQTQYYFN